MNNKNLSEMSKDEKRKLILFTSASEILSKLATDSDDYIRELVAKNIHTPKSVLSLLANDDSWSVRVNVTKNQNTPKDVLLKFSKDEDKILADIALNILKNME